MRGEATAWLTAAMTPTLPLASSSSTPGEPLAALKASIWATMCAIAAIHNWGKLGAM